MTNNLWTLLSLSLSIQWYNTHGNGYFARLISNETIYTYPLHDII